MQVLKYRIHQVKWYITKEVYGNAQQNAESKTVPVKVGDFIELTHLEGAERAILTNLDNNKREKALIKSNI
jgi:hypothetical protein